MKFHASRKFIYSVASVVFIFLVAFLIFVISPFAKNEIPPDFNSARTNASVLSKEIVNLLNEATDNISKINNNANTYSEMLAFVLDSMQSTENARAKATDLASELEKMALSVPKISPNDAKQTAIVAISSETALINKLIFYNEKLTELLKMLQKRYSGSNISIDKINQTIDEINQSAEDINNFNSQFVNAMNRFDSYYKD